MARINPEMQITLSYDDTKSKQNFDKATDKIENKARQHEQKLEQVKETGESKRLQVEKNYNQKELQASKKFEDAEKRRYKNHLNSMKMADEKARQKILKGHQTWSAKMLKSQKAMISGIKNLVVAYVSMLALQKSKEIIDWVGDMNTLADAYGVSATQLIKMEGALARTGFQYEKFTNLLTGVQVAQGKVISDDKTAIEAFDRLGLSINDAHAPVDELTLKLINLLAVNKNNKDMTDALNDLVGKRYVSSLKLASTRVDELNEAMKGNLPITQEMMNKFDDLSADMATMSFQFKIEMAQALNEMVPQMKKFMESIDPQLLGRGLMVFASLMVKLGEFVGLLATAPLAVKKVVTAFTGGFGLIVAQVHKLNRAILVMIKFTIALSRMQTSVTMGTNLVRYIATLKKGSDEWKKLVYLLELVNIQTAKLVRNFERYFKLVKKLPWGLVVKFSKALDKGVLATANFIGPFKKLAKWLGKVQSTIISLFKALPKLAGIAKFISKWAWPLQIVVSLFDAMKAKVLILAGDGVLGKLKGVFEMLLYVAAKFIKGLSGMLDLLLGWIPFLGSLTGKIDDFFGNIVTKMDAYIGKAQEKVKADEAQKKATDGMVKAQQDYNKILVMAPGAPAMGTNFVAIQEQELTFLEKKLALGRKVIEVEAEEIEEKKTLTDFTKEYIEELDKQNAQNDIALELLDKNIKALAIHIGKLEEAGKDTKFYREQLEKLNNEQGKYNLFNEQGEKVTPQMPEIACKAKMTDWNTAKKDLKEFFQAHSEATGKMEYSFRSVMNGLAKIAQYGTEVLSTIFSMEAELRSNRMSLVQAEHDKEMSLMTEKIENYAKLGLEGTSIHRKALMDKEALEKKHEKKMKTMQAKAWDSDQDAKRIMVIMNTAVAIMQGYAQLGPILGNVFAALTTTMGLYQLNIISKMKNPHKAKFGGWVDGHGYGDNQPYMLTSGEYVVNRDSARENASMLEYINSGGNSSPQNNVTVNITGNVLSQDFIESDVMPQLEEAINKGHSIRGLN